jgi:hypothetical protein
MSISWHTAEGAPDGLVRVAIIHSAYGFSSLRSSPDWILVVYGQDVVGLDFAL